MNANMLKWEIIWIVRFVNYVSVDLNEINDNSNKNSEFCKKYIFE